MSGILVYLLPLFHRHGLGFHFEKVVLGIPFLEFRQLHIIVKFKSGYLFICWSADQIISDFSKYLSLTVYCTCPLTHNVVLVKPRILGIARYVLLQKIPPKINR